MNDVSYKQYHGIIWSSVSSSAHEDTAKVQINLPISMTEIGQRISDTMFVKGPLIFQLH